MKNNYLVTLYANNHSGMLLRIVQIIAKKNLNIEKLSLNESAVFGVAWINFMIKTDSRTIQTLVKLIEKQVDVLQAFYVTNNNTVVSRVAITEV